MVGTPLAPKPSPSRYLNHRCRAPFRSLEELPVGPMVIRLAVVYVLDPHAFGEYQVLLTVRSPFEGRHDLQDPLCV